MRRAAGLALAALLAACAPASGRVDPADHKAYFLWAGVEPRPDLLRRAEVLYILAGEVPARGQGDYVSLRPGVPRLPDQDLWLVVRAARLDWNEQTWARVLGELRRWDNGTNRLIGLQIDFDAATRGLDGYGAFLQQLRVRLDPRYKLSITGLMDWSANGDPAALARLKGTVDEVVVQTYQGRETIPGYEAYLARLARVPVPHKVALVEGGAWREPSGLRQDPGFRGTVVFLVNPR